MYAFSELRHARDLAFKGLGDLGSEDGWYQRAWSLSPVP